MLTVFFAMLASPVAAQGDVQFPGACDGSAAVAVAPDTFLSAYDEKNYLMALNVNGTAIGQPFALDGFLQVPDGAESDIEGGALSTDGRIYWIGSHGRNKNAKRKPERLRFFATAWNGEVSTVGTARSDLLDAILSDPQFKDLGLDAASNKAPEAEGGLNIEGLGAAPDGALFIGFRNPLIDRDGVLTALVITLLNPAELIDKAASKPEFSGPLFLDLGKRGIRSLDRLGDGSYRIIAGDPGDIDNFALFSWDGAGKPVKLDADLAGLRPEALIEAGPGSLMILSDDGTDACKASPMSLQSFRGRKMP